MEGEHTRKSRGGWQGTDLVLDFTLEQRPSSSWRGPDSQRVDRWYLGSKVPASLGAASHPRDGSPEALIRRPGNFSAVEQSGQDVAITASLAPMMPVYWARDGARLRVSCSARSLTRSRRADLAYLAGLLSGTTITECSVGQAPFEDVTAVAPGTRVRHDARGAHRSWWWGPRNGSDSSTADSFADLLEGAVSNCVGGRRGAVTTDWSGGADSRAIAMLAARTTGASVDDPLNVVTYSDRTGNADPEFQRARIRVPI